ncbi:hypothetical protein [Sciscionella sediminilitoris]|uniref:hypothetical protein n=1 Tax=Sciscionella sediminilitoris TaxID=1445613 RepID=UPI00068BC0A0|nr:hypothetical protein [Sciscionella sp. SE31]
MSSKLDSLGSELSGIGSKLGGAHPGSNAFGVVGQALSGKLNGVFSSVEQHIGKISGAAQGASSKVKKTASSLHENEQHNKGLFNSIGSKLSGGGHSGGGGHGGRSGGGTTRSGRPGGGGGGGPIRRPGGGGRPGGGSGRPGGGGGYPGGGRPGGGYPGGGGGGGRRPGGYHPYARPPQPAPPRPPIDPNVPASTHNHVINGDYNANQNRPTGGHVLGPDAQGYPNPDPTKYGYGVQPGAGGPAQHNGVYNMNNPTIQYDPAYGNLSKPGMSTMFPQGVPGETVEQIGNQSWNSGAPSGGLHGNNKWSGSTNIPHYPYPHGPYMPGGQSQPPPYPYVGGKPINIEGYWNPNTGQSSTYYPSQNQ